MSNRLDDQSTDGGTKMTASQDEGQQEPQTMRVRWLPRVACAFVAIVVFAACFWIAIYAWALFVIEPLGILRLLPGQMPVPESVAVGLFLLVPVWVSVWASKNAYLNLRWRKVEWDGSRCVQCDYDLTGNTSGRCPECGWEIPERSEDETA